MTQVSYSLSALPPKRAAKIRVDEAGCWLWIGHVGENGYGTAAIGNNRKRYAHRLIYELLAGPVPWGYVIDHLCKVRHCVNPAHLEVVTPQENARRVRSVGQPNKDGLCRRGLHPWTPANIFFPPDGRPRCRECRREAVRRSRAVGKGRKGRPGTGQGSLLN